MIIALKYIFTKGLRYEKKLKELWNRSFTQWMVKTVYYLAILFALLWLYGFHDTNTNPFIYNEF
ncbi:teichoic acid D-Ala incorporation-associated protein DltX (plasmid) [Bacillus cereus]|nr:teichoic acid D-Ala incorporation-associated protein DltX [Bacillus cereus]